jgi:prevent-host-death family protein
METVNMHEAKSRLSKLVEAVESGREAEIVLARNGRPVARIVPLSTRSRKKVPMRIGVAKGQFNLPDDFDADNDLIQAMFEGRASK